MSDLPQAESADTDAVQMALQAAHTLWSRGDASESLRWLKRAAESASDEGADLRSLQLAKAAAELRAKLFPSASDAAPPVPARVPTQRELSGARPLTAPASQEADGAAMANAGEVTPVPRSEDSSPYASRSPSSAPQYVVHRPREQQRQLMGLSSSTMETARQHNGPSSYPSVPSWSASSERRTSSPPPLPRSIDEYEELEAEPINDSDAQAASAWAGTAAPTWRPSERTSAREALEAARREAASDSSPRVATLPPPSFQAAALSSSPPPLPELSAFGDEDGDPMRPEQPTTLLPPQEEQGLDPAFFSAPGGASAGASSANSSPSHHSSPYDGGSAVSSSGEVRWDAEPRPSWDTGGGYSWSTDVSRSGTWAAGGSEPPTSASESMAPPKLTARVHHQAVRVSFAPDPRAPGQYVVRALREGERPLAGERVALLVALEPGVPLV
ncbi:MAG: hypothetical protein RL685_4330 [Pseudomonadota bacterium]|jgi:hypothetical protein